MKRDSIAFEGTIRELRRGGWAARGLVVTSRHGQLVETQIGPKAFETKGGGDAWLRAAAASLNIDSVSIALNLPNDAKRRGMEERQGPLNFPDQAARRHARGRRDLPSRHS